MTKLTVRLLMAVGALIGLTSCPRNPQECVYGPPPEADTIGVQKVVYGPPPSYRQRSVDPIEDVYGPPVKDMPDTIEADEDVPETSASQ